MPDTAEILAQPHIVEAIKALITRAMSDAGIMPSHCIRATIGLGDRIATGEPVAEAVALVDDICNKADAKVRGVTFILIRDGAVLLERCDKKAKVLGVGEWFIPGGKLEPGETPERALAREIREEWPWADLLDFAALPIVEGSSVPPGPKGVFLMRPYVVAVDGTPDKTTPEGTPLKWVLLDEALASPVPQVRMMVAAAIATGRERRAKIAEAIRSAYVSGLTDDGDKFTGPDDFARQFMDRVFPSET